MTIGLEGKETVGHNDGNLDFAAGSIVVREFSSIRDVARGPLKTILLAKESANSKVESFSGSW